MANKTITQRIAFVGGEEMEVQLKKIGDAGVYQFKRIQDAAANTDIGNKFAAGIADFQARFDSLGKAADKLGKSFDDLGKSSKEFAKNVGEISLVLTGLAAGFLKLAADAGKSQEALENSARAAGLSVKDYTSLRDAFRIAGVEGDGLDRVFQKMARSIEEHNRQTRRAAQDEADLSKQYLRGKISADEYLEKLQDMREKRQEDIKSSGDAFDKLGLDITQFANNPKEAIYQITQALNAMPEGIEKVALASELFGKGASKILAVGDNFQALEKEAAKFRVETEGFAESNKAFDDSLDHIKITLESLQRAFFGVFGGQLARLINAIGLAIVANQSKILAFAESIRKGLEPIIADLVHFFQNGFKIEDNISPQGKTIIQTLQNIYDAAVLVFKVFAAGFAALTELGNGVSEVLKTVFGVDINGQVLALAASVLYLTGGFKVLTDSLGVFFNAFKVGYAAVSLLLSPGGLLLAGLAALAIAITAVIVLWPKIQQGFQDFLASVKDFFQPVLDLWDQFIGKLKEVARWLGIVGGEQQGGGDQSTTTVVAKAGGGYISGPGTATSDSILARLSNGEFVQRAAAVAYYGPAFMSALNSMRIPKSVLTGLAGFANGGFVNAISHSFSDMPRFATGGIVDGGGLGGLTGGTSGHPLTLVIDGEKFTGMVAEDSTFNKLQRYAVRRNVQSAGRKPLWVG